jgi:hypothetical protein
MPKITRIIYSPKYVSLADAHEDIRVVFSYAGWQQWLRKNGSVTFPFTFNTKSKGAEFIQ